MALQISRPCRPILCAVLDGPAFGSDPRGQARKFFEAGVDWIQLRDRILADEALHRLACLLVEAAQDVADNGHATASREIPRVILNRRSDLVLASGADGVHLGFDAIGAEEARALLGEAALIGTSLHSVSEVESACGGALSYAQLAPIWDPISKPASRPPLGPNTLGEAVDSRRDSELPILAQGGLDPDRARQAIEVGAGGIALTGRLARSQDPLAAIVQLRKSLDEASPPKGAPSRNQNEITGDRAATP